MGGVDRMDANVSQCRITLHGKRWYFPIFLELIDIAVNNAWLLYRITGNKIDQNSFKTEVAESLLLLQAEKSSRSSATAPSLRFDNTGHLVDATENSKEMRCAQCQNKTRFQCIKCKRALHPKLCFLAYHRL